MPPDFKPLNPYDVHNQQLHNQVHPPTWTNPEPNQPYHLVVIGAGTAGLVTAAGAAGLGARVALIERELMGGDCLNVGCVPSKAILRSARVAASIRQAEQFGLSAGAPQVDFGRTMERMRRLRADISPNDSAQRFSQLGVDVYFGQGAFESDGVLRVDAAGGQERQLQFKKAVIASGARAAAPPIPGLDAVDYLTNETLFSLTELPSSLIVLGSGPIGCEMAQAFARLGCQVTLLERQDRIMTREDPAAAAIVHRQMQADGVRIILNCGDLRVDDEVAGRVRVHVEHGEGSAVCEAERLLVAVGRAPNIEDLQLDNVNVHVERRGVVVNDFLQTTNPRIYAAGDVCSAYKFTHAADFQARIVIQNTLFALGPFGRKRASDLVIPWATYTSPEVAHVGLYAHEAQSQGVEIDTYQQDLADVDRAILDGETEGFVKVYTKRGTDTIVGATIVAEHAGDMISELTLAIRNRVGLSQIAATIHPYPTQADAIRKLGDQYNRTKLTPRAQSMLNWLRRINVGS